MKGKTNSVLILIAILCIITVGCSNEESFLGTIIEMNGEEAVVYIEEGEILSSGDQVYVDLSVNSERTFEIGDRIRVGYDGEVRESYPLQIQTTSVQLHYENK